MPRSKPVLQKKLMVWRVGNLQLWLVERTEVVVGCSQEAILWRKVHQPQKSHMNPLDLKKKKL